MRLLVTGAAGFIGSNFVRLVQRELPSRDAHQVGTERGRVAHLIRALDARHERALREVVRRPARVELEVAQDRAVVPLHERLAGLTVARTPGREQLGIAARPHRRSIYHEAPGAGHARAAFIVPG